MLADLDSHPQDASTQVRQYSVIKRDGSTFLGNYIMNKVDLNICQSVLNFVNFLFPLSCTTMCLTTNTSQGIITNLHTRAKPLLRVGHPWATPLIPRANTTLCPRTPVSTSHLSTPPPTSRTTTPPPTLSPTLSPSRPLTPRPRLPPGPGSASRSRRHSPSPTLRPGDRQNRRTPRPLLASTCRAPLPSLRQIRRAGTLHIKLRRCTLRWGTRGAAPDPEGELTRFSCPREGWRITKPGRGLHRVLLISPARWGHISTSVHWLRNKCELEHINKPLPLNVINMKLTGHERDQFWSFSIFTCDSCVSFFSPLQQGIAASRPEEELERLTKKLVYDMNHPPSEDYFGTVASHRANDLWWCHKNLQSGI